MPLRIHRLERADAALLRDVRLAALADAPRELGEPLASALARSEHDWSEAATSALVAELDGRCLGMAYAFEDPSEPAAARVGGMWVAPSARRGGVASRLLEAAVSWAIAQSKQRLRLWVSPATPAEVLYRRAGFVPTGAQKPFPGDDSRSVIEMQLEIDAQDGTTTHGMIDLKPVTVSDAELIFESWGRYPQNFARLTASVFGGLVDAERYLNALFSSPRSIAFHILNSRGSVVGIVKANVVEHRAQVGYVVHEPFRGRGFATRAVQATVHRLQADPSISRIWATCALDNPASVRVLEKCGFQCEGILKNWVVYPALGAHAVDNYSYVRLP